jgi:hypothetical protein
MFKTACRLFRFFLHRPACSNRRLSSPVLIDVNLNPHDEAVSLFLQLPDITFTSLYCQTPTDSILLSQLPAQSYVSSSHLHPIPSSTHRISQTIDLIEPSR